jgi:hypothetical protein
MPFTRACRDSLAIWLFLDKLTAAHAAGRLKFFGAHAHLDDARVFAASLAPLRTTEWVVYAKRPFGGPEAVLAYLSRYTPHARELLAAPIPREQDNRPNDGDQLGPRVLAHPSPCCGGRMIVIETFERGRAPRASSLGEIRIDTS